jgi:hypothetical protein
MKTMWSPKAKLIAALAVAGGLGALGAGAIAQPQGEARPGFQLAQDGGHGWHRRGGGPRHMARLCDEERRSDWIDARIERVEGAVELRSEQEEAWAGLTETVRAASARVGEACAEVTAAGRPQNASEHLARTETMLSTGLAIVQEVRPAFDDFYATLDDDQKATIDRMTRHGRRG